MTFFVPIASFQHQDELSPCFEQRIQNLSFYSNDSGQGWLILQPAPSYSLPSHEKKLKIKKCIAMTIELQNKELNCWGE